MTEVAVIDKVRRGRIKLLAILSLFFLPFMLAVVMHKQYRESGEVDISSHGELVWPAVPLTNFSLRDVRAETQGIDLGSIKSRWTLVYPVLGECQEICQRNIYHMRQIHISLNKNAHRVQRLLVTDAPEPMMAALGNKYPALLLATGSADSLTGFNGQIAAAVEGMSVQVDSLYLVDPLGNVMMRFASDLDPKGILKDIKRVLRASRIG